MIIYFDTETTGLRPGKICQLSYILEGEDVRAKNMYFAVPFVEPGAEKVHGLTPEKLALLSGGRRFSDRMEEIAADFAEADVIVGHNVRFDIDFLAAEFSYEYDRFRYRNSFCSMRAFTPVLKLPRAGGRGLKYPKLSELMAFFEVYPYDVTRAQTELFRGAGGAHDARYDTAALWLCMREARARNYFEQRESGL